MAIKTYSNKTDGSTKLTNNFTVSEFACKDGSDFIIIDSDLVGLLQSIRSHFGKAVNITSAYRNPTYNKSIGSSDGSQHVVGTAADITISGVTPLAVAQYAETLLLCGGIGLYDTFTHVDVRTVKARWKNTTATGNKEVSVTGF